MCHFSMLIPIYNEESIIEKNLGILSNFLKGENYEILACDDCSKDRTYEVLTGVACKQQRVHPIRFRQRIGKGGVIKAAMREAKGNVILIMDADLATDPKHIPEFIAEAETDHALVIGTRTMRCRTTQGATRILLSWAYNSLVRLFLRTGISDHQCGFKALETSYAKALFAEIKNDDFLFDTELIVRAKKHRVPVKEIGVIWNDNRSHGKGHLDVRKAVLETGIGLIDLVLRANRTVSNAESLSKH